jgi:hypothetical protein
MKGSELSSSKHYQNLIWSSFPYESNIDIVTR